mgnify:FL=1
MVTQDTINRINELYRKSKAEGLTSAEAEEQKQAAEKQLETIVSGAQNLDSERKEVTDGLALLAEKRDEQTNRISGLNRLYASKTEKLKAAEKEQNDLTMSVREKEQKMRLLRDLENSMEGFGHAVKQVLSAGKNGRIRGIIGSVAQIISVPSEYSLAVETALGGALQNIVTENEDAAKRGIGLLKETKGGRATFLPITSVKGNRLNESGLDGLSLIHI